MGNGTKVYKSTNVFEESLKRIRWLFEEFENVSVSISGGKDSTVVFNLALMVAREMGRLPLDVIFIDQEMEWQLVIDHIRAETSTDEVRLKWFQVPYSVSNASSSDEQSVKAWEEGVEWMRPREPNGIFRLKGITQNSATDDMWKAICERQFGDGSGAMITGVRAEESPMRMLGLTGQETYKGETWGKVYNKKKGHFNFHPIYDWSYTDIWKAIHDNKWPYCKVYDLFYQYGLPIPRMRVSSIVHPSALTQLFILQEVERETYTRLCKRIKGISSSSHVGKEDFFIKDLPFMFVNWKEYRNHLLENLIVNSLHRELFRLRFNKMDEKYEQHFGDVLMRIQINSILANDPSMSKLDKWESSVGSKLKITGFVTPVMKGKKKRVRPNKKKKRRPSDKQSNVDTDRESSS